MHYRHGLSRSCSRARMMMACMRSRLAHRTVRTLEGEARVFHIKFRCSIRIRLIRISKGRCRPANREQGIEKKRLLTHHMHLHSTALHRLRTYVRENGTGNTAIRIQIRDSEVELEKKLGKGIRNALPRALVPTHVQNGH